MTKVPIVVWCHAPKMYDRVYEDGVNLHDERWRCKSWPLMLIDLKFTFTTVQFTDQAVLYLAVDHNSWLYQNPEWYRAGRVSVLCAPHLMCSRWPTEHCTGLALVMGITSACISSPTTPDFKTVHRHNCDQYASNMVSDQMVPPPVPNHGHTIWSQWSKCSQPFPIRVGGSQASHLLQLRKEKK